MTLKQLNHKVRALAHGTLGLTEDEYRTIVAAVDPRSDGHITHCGDEEANLVLLQLRRMLDVSGRRGSRARSQEKMIARLMEYLRWNWQDTAHFCYKITKHRTTRLCNAAELSKVIRGLVAIIDHDLELGKITMTEVERVEYERHVKHHRIHAETTREN
jgi:hypothetical protein